MGPPSLWLRRPCPSAGLWPALGPCGTPSLGARSRWAVARGGVLVPRPSPAPPLARLVAHSHRLSGVPHPSGASCPDRLCRRGSPSPPFPPPLPARSAAAAAPPSPLEASAGAPSFMAPRGSAVVGPSPYHSPPGPPLFTPRDRGLLAALFGSSRPAHLSWQKKKLIFLIRILIEHSSNYLVVELLDVTLVRDFL